MTNLKNFQPEEKQKLILRTHELRRQGYTVRKIAERFGMTYYQLKKLIEKNKGDNKCITN